MTASIFTVKRGEDYYGIKVSKGPGADAHSYLDNALSFFGTIEQAREWAAICAKMHNHPLKEFEIEEYRFVRTSAAVGLKLN